MKEICCIKEILYTVADTNIEICLDVAMTKSDVDVSAIDYQSSTYLKMFLKNDPRIQIEIAGPYHYNANG